MSDTTYPPKNRLSQALPVLRIEIEHANGIEALDPNGLVMLAASTPERITDLVPIRGRVSVISGHPAVLYRAGDVEIALTPQEAFGLASRDLLPDDYFALRERFGTFFVHEDFYAEDTGEALQPLRLR
jgi:hypothetical protein